MPLKEAPPGLPEASRDGRPTMTQSNGVPVSNDINSLTVGVDGPILLQDLHFLDKLGHFDRERIPPRVVHARGAGAHGYFEVTSSEIQKYCKAALFSHVGKKTPLFARFSLVAPEPGGPETIRNPRGFAIKFYTEEGNWDLVGNNTPVFFMRDGIQFPDFIHTQKVHPKNNLPDPDAFWEFFALMQESIHQVTMLFTDRGTPYGYRFMHGFGNNTYKLVNARGEAFYCKFHYLTNQGIRNFTHPESIRMAGYDPDFATRDLFNAIEAGDYPSWELKIQVMPIRDAEKYYWNVFDVTKVWPHADYPLISIGTLVLNRNPENYFAETEQAAFCPFNLVPGIEPSADRMLQTRLFSYIDTQRHRLGPNFDQIPINQARFAKVNAPSIRDGFMTVTDNFGSKPDHFPTTEDPNSAAPNERYAQHKFGVKGEVGRHYMGLSDKEFQQPRALWVRVLSQKDRDHLVYNIVAHLKAAKVDIQKRMVRLFYQVHPDLGTGVARGLGLDIEPIAAMKLGWEHSQKDSGDQPFVRARL